MEGKINYTFSAGMWQYGAPGGWYFVSVPEAIAAEIREHLKWQEEGWGRMRARAGIGDLTWDTAIWFDTKMNTYILPIKAVVRNKCKLTIDQPFEVNIWV